MANTIADRVGRVADEIFDIVKEYTVNHNPPILALRDQAVALLRREGLLRRQKTNSRFVAVHPRNRHGDGIILDASRIPTSPYRNDAQAGSFGEKGDRRTE